MKKEINEKNKNIENIKKDNSNNVYKSNEIEYINNDKNIKNIKM